MLKASLIALRRWAVEMAPVYGGVAIADGGARTEAEDGGMGPRSIPERCWRTKPFAGREFEFDQRMKKAI